MNIDGSKLLPAHTSECMQDPRSVLEPVHLPHENIESVQQHELDDWTIVRERKKKKGSTKAISWNNDLVTRCLY